MLIGVVHIQALGERMYGKQVHCSQWSILRCYTYLQVCQDLLLRNLKRLENPTEGNLPDLEEMGHHELVDLVKQLLVERASKPTSLTNPNKDVSVAGHVSVNQESLVQSSQAILQGLAEGGYIHAKTPKFESFFGDDKKNKLDFDMWERQVLSAATTHSGTAVKQAMMESLKGQALMVISQPFHLKLLVKSCYRLSKSNTRIKPPMMF